MDTRRFAISLVVGAASALAFVGVHPRGHSHLPVLGERAAAQTLETASIGIRSLPDTGSSDPWHRFELTIPPSTPPLDMHVAFLVDGKGSEAIFEESHAWPQTLPFKYRLSSDDSGMNDISDLQGPKHKKVLITYSADVGDYGTVSDSETIRFRHGSNGPRSIYNYVAGAGVAIGARTVLDDRMLSDKYFTGSFGGPFRRLGSVPKTPPGTLHNVVVYVQFLPHQGPPSLGRSCTAQLLNLP